MESPIADHSEVESELKQEPVFQLHPHHHRAIESRYCHPWRSREANPWWVINPLWAVAAAVAIVLATVLILVPPLYQRPEVVDTGGPGTRQIIVPDLKIATNEPMEIDPSLLDQMPRGIWPGEGDNPFVDAFRLPRSAFPIEVDTAAWSNIQKFLALGQLPPRDAVRIEEMINAFGYTYRRPTGENALAANVEVSQCPWNPEHRLARIGIKGRELVDVNAVIAKDATVQVEFNPSMAMKYRLIGYENRLIAREGGSMTMAVKSGHAVTALYEVVKTKSAATQPSKRSEELMVVRLRYSRPDGTQARPVEVAVHDSCGSLSEASADFKFAAAVAQFGLLLRNSEHKAKATYEGVVDLARASEMDSKAARTRTAELMAVVNKVRELQSRQ